MEHNITNNQLAYRFTAYISDLGKINVPEIMQNIYNKKVEIILLIPKDEKETNNSDTYFYELINQYNSIDEPDLDINTIFNEREQKNTRKFVFD